MDRGHIKDEVLDAGVRQRAALGKHLVNRHAIWAHPYRTQGRALYLAVRATYLLTAPAQYGKFVPGAVHDLVQPVYSYPRKEVAGVGVPGDQR